MPVLEQKLGSGVHSVHPFQESSNPSQAASKRKFPLLTFINSSLPICSPSLWGTCLRVGPFAVFFEPPSRWYCSGLRAISSMLPFGSLMQIAVHMLNF